MTGDTLETRGKSERELILETLALIKEQNSSVLRLLADIYGDPTHTIAGLKPMILKHDKWIDRAHTVLAGLAIVAGSLGVVEVTRLIQWLVAGTP